MPDPRSVRIAALRAELAEAEAQLAADSLRPQPEAEPAQAEPAQVPVAGEIAPPPEPVQRLSEPAWPAMFRQYQPEPGEPQLPDHQVAGIAGLGAGLAN
jgi:hypothetical protein